MAAIAILHASLPRLMPVAADAGPGALVVRQSSTEMQEFRRNLAMRRIDALVVSLDLLGEEPLHQIDHLRKYTRPKVVVVIYNFTDMATLQAIESRPDLVILREAVTPARLRRVLAHELDEPELIHTPNAGAEPAADVDGAHGLPSGPPPARRFDSVELHGVLERASEGGYEYTQHVAELLISLQGFEDYCRRRNAGRSEARGLHADVEHGAGHARAGLEECLARLCSATRLKPLPDRSCGDASGNDGPDDGKVTRFPFGGYPA